MLRGVNSVNHCVTLGVSPCHVMQACFWRWRLISVKSCPVLGVEPEEASQEALGEDAILHRSSGRPGEDKKKVEKMLGELGIAIDSFWILLDGLCCRVRSLMVPPKRSFLSSRSFSDFLFTMIMGGINKKIKLNTTRRKVTYPSTRRRNIPFN